MKFKKSFVLFATFLVSLLLISLAFTVVVLAKDGSPDLNSHAGGPQVADNISDDSSSSSQIHGKGLGTEASGSGREKGQAIACQAHENSIKTRSTHLVEMATDMENKFDAIAQRVENFYTTKVVPSGKTVSNYGALVADIQAQKAAVQSALTAAQADAHSFSCSFSNPKAQVTQYRTDMQSVIKALKNYRTSVKNLIVAVHSVTGQINSNKGTASGSAKIKNASGSAEQG